MRIIKTDQDDYVRFIPFEAEHRFFETKQSTIGLEAGMGLFLRETRSIPQGCIICEYRGRSLPSPPVNTSYVVRVRATNSYIDGISLTSEHLSLASFINDNGPRAANTGMMEFDRYPGRVFMVAFRDIEPGEELFCLYGATYWGLNSYAEVKVVENSDKRDARLRYLNSLRAHQTCPRCKKEHLQRATMLHQMGCGDPLVEKRLQRIECVPYSEFTAVPTSAKVVPSQVQPAAKKAVSLVDRAEPLTFYHSHEDVIRDYEFSFEDVKK
ncbi:hypothetical protein AGDE_07888 [Angomonas deanei]|nr:hypothetical protein AGDE_07888 [Angomonas deanei]|eukprot:EPY34490.1 hypothetical protein AGDE_07888 [Angomonas deanei]